MTRVLGTPISAFRFATILPLILGCIAIVLICWGHILSSSCRTMFQSAPVERIHRLLLSAPSHCTCIGMTTSVSYSAVLVAWNMVVHLDASGSWPWSAALSSCSPSAFGLAHGGMGWQQSRHLPPHTSFLQNTHHHGPFLGLHSVLPLL